MTDFSGTVIGEVDELLVDVGELMIRYLVVTLSPFGKKAIVPIGLAEQDSANHAVRLPEISYDQLSQLPEYLGVTAPQFESELAIRHSFEGHSTAPYEHPQFYIHQHFNEERFYDTTDIKDEPVAVKNARAERARRIVARLEDVADGFVQQPSFEGAAGEYDKS